MACRMCSPTRMLLSAGLAPARSLRSAFKALLRVIACEIPPFDMMLLLKKDSLFATFPGLNMHLAKREDVLARGQELFDVVASGAVKIQSPTRLPLAEAAEAHRRLEARQNTGATVLIP